MVDSISYRIVVGDDGILGMSSLDFYTNMIAAHNAWRLIVWGRQLSYTGGIIGTRVIFIPD